MSGVSDTDTGAVRLVNVDTGEWREFGDAGRARIVMRDLERIDDTVSLRIEQQPFSAIPDDTDQRPGENEVRSLGVQDDRYTGITPDTASEPL